MTPTIEQGDLVVIYGIDYPLRAGLMAELVSGLVLGDMQGNLDCEGEMR